MERDSGIKFNNVVVMGMGEPMDNYDSTQKAMRILHDQEGLGLGRRRITVSTSGLLENMKRFIKDDWPVSLAVSLHSADPEIRSRLMPINRSNPLDQLWKVMRDFTYKRRLPVTLEYILLKDVNDRPEDAKKLASYCKDLLCKVNLIRYNPVPTLPFDSPSEERVSAFREDLKSRGVEFSCGNGRAWISPRPAVNLASPKSRKARFKMSVNPFDFRLTPGEKNLLRRALILLASFTFILILAGLVSLSITRQHQPMIVPRIIGMDQAQAESALASKGLHLKIIRSQYDDHMPEGLIVLQSKKANEYMRRGQTIEAALSKGSPKVKIPSLVGLSFPQAQITLAGGRLKVGRESLLTFPQAAQDTVLAQVPSPDELVDSFTEVNLLVAAPAPDPAFLMPNLVNQPLEQAFKVLRPAGITIEKIKTEVHDDLDSETLLAQDPPPGTKIEKKDEVSFTVSAKSSDANLKSRYAKVVYDMPDGNPRRLQIDVFDGSGTRTLYNKMETPKDHVEIGVSVSGKASAQIYLNQEFVKEIPIE